MSDVYKRQVFAAIGTVIAGLLHIVFQKED